jgi:outer membrane autotransporter protein
MLRGLSTARPCGAAPFGFVAHPWRFPSGGGISRRRQLLAGCARMALLALPAAISLGIALPDGARAQTTLGQPGANNTEFNLSSSNYNDATSFSFGAGQTDSASPYGVYGAPGKTWTFTNAGSIHGSTAGVYISSGTIVNMAGGTITGSGGGNASYGITISGSGYVTNAGVITGSGDYNASFGITISGSGTIVNMAGGTITGQNYGIKISGSGYVSNAGTITSSIVGVGLGDGGLVVNSNTGTITGVVAGVYINGAAGTVRNSGTIMGSKVGGGPGVALNAGGLVVNSGTSAVITGGATGVLINGGAGTVRNSGTIATTGAVNDGVELQDGGLVVNSGTSGAITGVTAGVSIAGAAGTVSNSGTITGTSKYGVLLQAGSSVSNSGLISGAAAGVKSSDGTSTLTNMGTIEATDTSGIGVLFTGSAEGTIDNFGTIIGAGGTAVQFAGGTNELILENGSVLEGIANGGTGTSTLVVTGSAQLLNVQETGFQSVDFSNATQAVGAGTTVANAKVVSGTLTNQGTLTGTVTVDAGTTLANAGSVSVTGASINAGSISNSGSFTTTGSFNNSGMVTGAVTGVSGGGTITNSGTIIGTGTGVALTASGSVSNSGLISGAVASVSFSGGTATLTNNGIIKGTGTSGIGVLFTGSAQGTIDNFGTIIGAGGTAIQFAGGTNELILESGSVLEGIANGGTGTNTLMVEDSAQLQSVQVTGFQYVGFRNATKAVDAGTTVSNAKVIAGTLTNQGTLNGSLTVEMATTLTNTSSVSVDAASINAGSISNSGSFTNNSTFSNTGSISNNGSFTNNSTFSNAGSISNSGSFTNNSTFITTGSFSNSGMVTGAGTGVSGDGTITNSGTIIGTTGDGVDLTAGGILTNTANSFIMGGQYGVQVGTDGTVTNAGTILDNTVAGASLGTNAVLVNHTGGTISGVVGVEFTGTGASATNAGTITGTGGVAVQFSPLGNDTLTLTTGSIIDGSIDGGTGSNAVILTGTGILASNIDDFGPDSSLTVDGDWSVSGDVTIPTVEVAAGGTLADSATIFGTLTNAGTLIPGSTSTIGTLTVNGDFVQQPTGTLQVALSSSTASRLQVNGTAELAGDVLLEPEGGGIVAGTRLAIVTATGGVSGTFANVTSAAPLLAPTLSFDANDAFVTLGQLSVTAGLANVGGTANETAVAAAFDAAQTQDPAGFAPTLNHLDTLTDAGLHVALDEMSGEVYSGLPSMALASADLFTGQIERQGQMFGANGGAATASALNAGSRAQLGTQGNLSVWFSGYGQSADISGDGNAHEFDSTTGGGVIGLDDTVRPDLRIGAALGMASTNFSIDDTGGHAQLTQNQVAIYADYAPDAPYYLNGLAGFAYGDGHVFRGLDAAGAGQASAYVADKQYFGAMETGYALPLNQAMQFTPFLQLSADLVDQNGSHEIGGGALDLSADGGDTGSLQSQLGGRFTGSLPLGGSRVLTTMVSVGWAHQYLPSNRVAVLGFSAAPGANFQVDGAQPARDAADISAGLATAIFTNANLYVTYDGSFSGTTTTHAVSGGLRVNW